MAYVTHLFITASQSVLKQFIIYCITFCFMDWLYLLTIVSLERGQEQAWP